MLEAAPLVLIMAGIAAYAVLAGADFGAGLWHLAGGRDVREHTHRSMAPVWEANHVWLIFVLVVCWTAYPAAFGATFSTLYVPLFAAGVGIVVRGATYALHGYGQRAGAERAVAVLFSSASVLTPFALGASVGAIAAGRVPAPDRAPGDPLESWLAPMPLLVGALAVATAAYLAAVYLAADATRLGRDDLARGFRARALGAGMVAGALTVAGLLVARADARELFDGLAGGAGLAAVLASTAGGVATLVLVVRRRYEPARASAALAVTAIVAGWPLAQSPDFLPGLTLDGAAAGDAVLAALLVSVAVGAVVLVPSLWMLFGLVLRGRFDAPGSAAPLSGATRPGSRRVPWPLLFAGLSVVGVGLTLLTEGGVGRVLGVVCLLAAIAAGAAVALAPSRLEGGEGLD